jgi:hypothetical protein
MRRARRAERCHVGREGGEGRGEEEGGAYREGRGWHRGGGSGRWRGGVGEGNELDGEEDMREGVEGREGKREAVWGARLTSGPHQGGWWRRLNHPRGARARGAGGDGWAAKWAQSGGGGGWTAELAHEGKGERLTRLGRVAGPRARGGGGREKKERFSLLKSIF